MAKERAIEAVHAAFITDLKSGKQLCMSCHSMEPKQRIYCSRCHAKLSSRIKHSLQKSWAYTLAATLFLIPANIFPIMLINKFGNIGSDTIYSGIAYFFLVGELFIGAVIFFASILIPIFKLLILYYLLISLAMRSKSHKIEKVKIFTMIHKIGKWSMLDIFVIGATLSLVHFEGIITVHTGIAATSFAVMVLLTMMATHSFDTRLLFDTAHTTTGETFGRV